METSRLKKILELAKNGVEGEKTSAQAMLERFMKQNNVTLADIEGSSAEPIEEFVVSWKDGQEKQLLINVVAKVLGEAKLWKRSGTRRKFVLKVTRSDFLQISYLKEVYWKSFLRERNALLAAFIWKNKIYSDQPSEDNKKAKREFDSARAAEMMRGMNATQVNKALPA